MLRSYRRRIVHDIFVIWHNHIFVSSLSILPNGVEFVFDSLESATRVRIFKS